MIDAVSVGPIEGLVEYNAFILLTREDMWRLVINTSCVFAIEMEESFVAENKAVTTIYRWTERIFLFFLALYLMKETERMTIFNLSPFIPVWADQFLLLSLFTTAVLKLVFLLLSDPNNRTKWLRLMLFGLPVSLIWIAVYQRAGDVLLAYLSILVLGCIGTDYRTLLKVQVCVVGSVVLSAALCCMGGAIENRIYWRSGTIRSSFGFTYPTNMAAYYFFLCVAAWLAWDKTWDPVFLLPGAVAIFISGVIADSRTSLICSGLFVVAVLWCWLLRINAENHSIIRIHKCINFLSKIAFPSCAFLAIALTVAYHEQLPFMSEMNEWTSNRLAQQAEAFYQYGFYLFGNSFPMRGFSSGFPVLDVNYVDCSYLQLLLLYGILIFLAYVVLWPFMTDSAIKAGKHRLSLGLALIALHSLLEQRLLDVSYNLLLIAPFSVIALRRTPELTTQYEHQGKEKLQSDHRGALITVLIMAVLVLLFWKPFLSWARTLWTVIWSPNLTIQLYQRGLSLLVSVCFLIGCSCLFYVIHQITNAILLRKKQKTWHVILLLICLCTGFLVLMKGNARLDRAMEEYAPNMTEDARVVSFAKKIDGLKLYEAELPTMYNRRFGGISTNFFNGEDLARLKNLAVITDLDNQWSAMFLSGFSYAEISDSHAVYSDSAEFIAALKRAGYHPVPYYSKERAVDMKKLAEWNQLEIDSDGDLIISSEQPLLNVPDLDLKQGNYTFYFDFTLLPSSLELTERAQDQLAFVLRFSDNSGARSLFEHAVTYGQFDDSGHMNYEATSYFYASGVEFAIIPTPGTRLKLHSVIYRITS